MAAGDVEVVRQAYAAFTRRDVERVREILDPDVEWGQPEALPWGGTYRGAEDVIRFLGSVGDHVDDLRVDVDEYLACGATVVALGRVEGRSRSTGREFAVRLAHVWRLRDARVVGSTTTSTRRRCSRPWDELSPGGARTTGRRLTARRSLGAAPISPSAQPFGGAAAIHPYRGRAGVVESGNRCL